MRSIDSLMSFETRRNINGITRAKSKAHGVGPLQQSQRIQRGRQAHHSVEHNCRESLSCRCDRARLLRKLDRLRMLCDSVLVFRVNSCTVLFLDEEELLLFTFAFPARNCVLLHWSMLSSLLGANSGRYKQIRALCCLGMPDAWLKEIDRFENSKVRCVT